MVNTGSVGVGVIGKAVCDNKLVSGIASVVLVVITGEEEKGLGEDAGEVGEVMAEEGVTGKIWVGISELLNTVVVGGIVGRVVEGRR